MALREKRIFGSLKISCHENHFSVFRFFNSPSSPGKKTLFRENEILFFATTHENIIFLFSYLFTCLRTNEKKSKEHNTIKKWEKVRLRTNFFKSACASSPSHSLALRRAFVSRLHHKQLDKPMTFFSDAGNSHFSPFSFF